MNLDSSQMNPKCVSKAQVCYICKELIAMMDKKMSATLICDLIKLLPKICSKLDSIVDELRERDSDQCREAVRLIFCLITKIFNWRDFSTAMYQRPLRGENLHSTIFTIHSFIENVIFLFRWLTQYSSASFTLECEQNFWPRTRE